MKLDVKIITICLFVGVLHVVFTDGWRVRIPNPVRVIKTGVRKVGRVAKTGVRKTARVVKTGVRKTGRVLKTGVRKTGEGLKKAGEGLKKAGQVTGKHLYKGLRESGKAFITASTFVSDILDRVNLVKFIWKKLGGCCTFDRSLCRAKSEYETIQNRLKYYNKDIDKTWKKVESAYDWIIKVNENVEDIVYHVERLTSDIKDSVEPLLPSLIVQYNNKMNSIKQDVKWKNSTVLHLTRQGVTTFVQIEMAWQCGKVASSVRKGLKDLKEARDKCVGILRESKNLLHLFQKGWRQLKAISSSQTLRARLEDIKALCTDLGHSRCVSTIGKYLRQITNANYGATFGLQEDIINTLAAVKYTYTCLKRKQRVITTVSEHCQKGNDDFYRVFLQAVQDFFPNKDLCTGLESKDYTTKVNVLKELRVFALQKNFYSSCELNNREVLIKTCLNYSTLASTYNLPAHESSRLLQECKTIVPALGKIQCNPSLCKNGGQCKENLNKYECECPKPFAGKNCETDTGRQCRAGVCQNGGRCEQEENSYSCFCAQGFAGRHCESRADFRICRTANWWGSFDKPGWSVCPSSAPYIVGLERSKSRESRRDYIYHLEAARCCQGTIPFINDNHDCMVADWVASFDRSNTWNLCPRGYYLSALERSRGQNLHNIERAKCCKPRSQPFIYKDCYKENVWSRFDHHQSGMISCRKPGYYITGLYRSNCDLLYCIEEFMCCSMLSAIENVKVLKVDVRSEGCDDKHKSGGCGVAVIKINGHDYSKRGRGYNFVVVDGWTGDIDSQVSFDTHANTVNVNKMIGFLRKIPSSKIVLAAIQDEGRRSMTSAAYKSLLIVGAAEPMKRDYRGSFALIGFSGNPKPGFVKQVDNLRGKGPSIVGGLITLPYTVCKDVKELGMKNGKIQDSQISASSEWNHNHGARNARLFFRRTGGRTGAWSSKVNNIHQWIQVDFKTPTLVVSIVTQGREDCCNQFVKTYTVSWSNDGRTFHPYKNQGRVKVFTGNKDRHSVVQEVISPPIIARYIRINPKSWNQHISLRLDFNGCY